MWRPEDWENPNEDICAKCDYCGCLKHHGIIDTFEAGADAMLEILRRDGTYFVSGEWTDDSTFETEEPGTVVWIPDEEKKDV